MIPIIFQAVAAIPNTTLNDPTAVPAWLAPFAHEVYSVINMFSWYVGGIFGLYILFTIINYIQRRQLYKRIESMEKSISEIKVLLNQNSAKLDSLLNRTEKRKVRK